MSNLFGCTSTEDVVIPENESGFFKPEDGQTRIRFLAGPIIYYVSQKFGADKKPIGDKKFYAYGDKNIDGDAKLVFSYIIFDYTDKKVKQWDVNTKGLLKVIQAINTLNPDLSAFDCGLTKKKGSNGYNEYQLVSGQAKPFENEEVIELFKNDNPFTKLQEKIAEKIEETKASQLIKESNDEFENTSTPASAQEAEGVFGKVLEEEPATVQKAREQKVSDDPFADQ